MKPTSFHPVLSVSELTGSVGVETDSSVYGAVGDVTSSKGTTSNDWLFTGEQSDGDADLYFLRALLRSRNGAVLTTRASSYSSALTPLLTPPSRRHA